MRAAWLCAHGSTYQSPELNKTRRLLPAGYFPRSTKRRDVEIELER